MKLSFQKYLHDLQRDTKTHLNRQLIFVIGEKDYRKVIEHDKTQILKTDFIWQLIKRILLTWFMAVFPYERQ